MFKIINQDTTWWSPKPNAVIDARDIAGLGVVPSNPDWSTHDYTLHVYLTGAATDDKREFHYVSLEELNEVLDFMLDEE